MSEQSDSETVRELGVSTHTYRSSIKDEVIHYATRESIFGHMVMATTNKGVCSVQFADTQDTLLSLLSAEFPYAKLIFTASRDTPELYTWMIELDEHITQGAARPDIPLDIVGTEFQFKVWQFLLTIKEGTVMSYGEVAAHINNPKAVRAVGTACGKNPIGVLIPCHRVMRSDGSLGGYRWGLERKKILLNKERQ
ncbi:hypothetical protein BCU68_10705 [Vibrio sp. 10N.286.49.B3]|uniref:methylated-DNA--[protein]-cysteine S-methyltransferase n=1 Tax=Vibrio sp. 10N.286.49.B3 TaxID=1880855 RepID=UPI000C84BF09|nr:methylated-DNA--[protein]-cysteine S-methyltransferase [Vibrio sp. 10N.286.49.B3]PMH45331.1 hypothetical protein BCU68_10705 [Vibrio sp. 10N.286.49.B3]